MTTYRPKNEKHAIAEVAFAIYLESELPMAAIEKLQALHPLFLHDFPKQAPAIELKVDVRDDGPKVSHETKGFHFLTDGSPRPKWRLGVHGNALIANCLEYSSWFDVWARVERWLVPFYAVCFEYDCKVAAVSLQYVDQFVRKQANQPVPLTDLFRADSDFLPEAFFANRDVWHLHQGKLHRESADAGETLSVLNIGSNVAEEIVTVTIDHLQRQVFPLPLRLEARKDLLPVEVGAVMAKLHDSNKAMLTRLITPVASNMISLGA